MSDETVTLKLAEGDKVEFADARGEEYVVQMIKSEVCVFTRIVDDEVRIRVFLIPYDALFIPPPADWSEEKRRTGRQLFKERFGTEEPSDDAMLKMMVMGAVKYTILGAECGSLDGYHMAFSKVNGNDFGGNIAAAVEGSKTVTAAQLVAESN